MTTPNLEEATDYAAQSRDFLEKSWDYLAAGDLHQASEKGWGAASHMLKAVAVAQGREYARHSDFNRLLNELAVSTGNDRIRELRGAANVLHINFYERKRNLNGEIIRRDIDSVAELLDLLAPMTGLGL
jgi:HEPN domain-containing protein